MGLEGRLQGDVGGAAAHEAVEVPVFQVDLQSELRLRSRWKRPCRPSGSRRARQRPGPEVAVDGLGMPMTWVPSSSADFPPGRRRWCWSHPPHHHQAVQLQLGAGLPHCSSSQGCRSCPAGAQHVEAAGVFIVGHHLPGDFPVLVGDDALGAGQEAEEHVLGMVQFGGLEDPAMTLWPPGAGPPERTMPRRRGLGVGRPPGTISSSRFWLTKGSCSWATLRTSRSLAFQGPGSSRARGQGRTQPGLIGPALFPEHGFRAQQILYLHLRCLSAGPSLHLSLSSSP